MHRSEIRAQRLRQIRTLRDIGLSNKQVGLALGLAPGTIYGYLNDPDGEKTRARKAAYRKPCPQCGTLMDGSGGRRRSPSLCKNCARERTIASRKWTHQLIIERIQLFAIEHGRPPCSNEWNIGFGRDRRWPPLSLVQKRFGSWNNAIAAAGFTPRRPGDKQTLGLVQYSNEELLQQMRELSVHGVAPTTSAGRGAGARIAKTLLRRGISWEAACAMAGLKSHRTLRNW